MASLTLEYDLRLSDAACRFARAMVGLAKGQLEAWHRTETIGKAAGMKLGKAKAALRELKACGYVLAVRDYTLDSKRRLLMLWRGASPTPLFGSNSDPHCGHENDRHPPDPPKEERVGISEPDRCADRQQQASAVSSPSKLAEVDQVVTRINAIATAADPTLAGKIARLFREWGGRAVLAALHKTERKARNGRCYAPLGYLVGTLNGFAADGRVPELAELAPAKPPKQPGLFTRIMKERLDARAGGEPCKP